MLLMILHDGMYSTYILVNTPPPERTCIGYIIIIAWAGVLAIIMKLHIVAPCVDRLINLCWTLIYLC